MKTYEGFLSDKINSILKKEWSKSPQGLSHLIDFVKKDIKEGDYDKFTKRFDKLKNKLVNPENLKTDDGQFTKFVLNMVKESHIA